MFFDQVLAFDHVKKEIHLIVTADLTRDPRHKPQAAYAPTTRRQAPQPPGKAPRQALPKPSEEASQGKLKLTPRTSKAAFLKSVARAKEYIASGDVFQCVLSQRFDCVPGVPPSTSTAPCASSTRRPTCTSSASA
jgi:anthranilate synthase component 1